MLCFALLSSRCSSFLSAPRIRLGENAALIEWHVKSFLSGVRACICAVHEGLESKSHSHG